MRLIEVCGPPGVGKSTLVRSLSGRLPPGQYVTSFEALASLSECMNRFLEDRTSHAMELQLAFYLEFLERAWYSIGSGGCRKGLIMDSSLGLHHLGYSRWLSKEGLLSATDLDNLQLVTRVGYRSLNLNVCRVVLSDSLLEVQRRQESRGRSSDLPFDAQWWQFIAESCDELEPELVVAVDSQHPDQIAQYVVAHLDLNS